MKVIPVIDVLGGVAVNAVKGMRQEYQPLKSSLCKSADPVDVAAAFRTFGFKELYMADLDAITCGKPNFSVLKRITGMEALSDG